MNKIKKLFTISDAIYIILIGVPFVSAIIKNELSSTIVLGGGLFIILSTTGFWNRLIKIND